MLTAKHDVVDGEHKTKFLSNSSKLKFISLPVVKLVLYKSMFSVSSQTFSFRISEVQRNLHKVTRENENPNVRKICDLLQRMIQQKGDNSRAIVFVKARETSRALASFLDKELQQIGIRVKELYGKNQLAGDEGRCSFVTNVFIYKTQK